MRLEVLTSEAARLAPVLCGALSAFPFTLAGRTGLAFQLGHRVSVDFDWFIHPEAFPRGLAERLTTTGLPIEIIQDSADTFECALSGVKCSFFAFDPTFAQPDIRLHGLPVAPVPDIGAMKLIAVAQRGARKDFHDLYEILKKLELRALALRLRVMYARSLPNPVHLAKSLVYFADAEGEPEPRMLTGAHWPEVKQFFSDHVRDHTDRLLEELTSL